MRMYRTRVEDSSKVWFFCGSPDPVRLMALVVITRDVIGREPGWRKMLRPEVLAVHNG